ncbi:hypothetical protein Anas_12276 [Armadillidium nasatum]|uniref:Uncharacterized protein n=1 Tax=Armadillidium nasatum TaxID=96803 RepID=A0A5N5T7L4_9CRUS|nr:hypothetical protein Anas_12276 [Armadillidium nasatum]
MLPYVDTNKESFIQFHRHLASRLIEAGEQIDEGKILRALLEIRTVVGLLDHRYQTSLLPNSFMVNNNLQLSNSIEDISEDLKFQFNTSLLDYEVVKPEFNLSSKWISPTRRNLNYLVTIVVDLCSGVEVRNRMEENVRLISQIRKQWKKMKIVLATNQSGVKVLCDKWNEPVLKTILRSIETPFTLILHEPLAVTPDLNITRLLNTIEEVKVVGVIGFAERGKDGGWDYTCSQLKLQGSHFNIINGYEYSKEACFFCDVTSNSFLVDTHLFKEVLPDFNLSFEMRKLDWFMRLQKLNVWTMTCPDVMIHTSNNVTDRKEFLINRKDFINSYNDKECYPEYEEHKTQFKELAQKYNLNISYDSK